MKAMVMVAHPDDCLIFAYSFIRKYPQHDWTICYLTYSASDERGREFDTFWRRRNVETKFLGFVDDWHDIENKKISFNEELAEQAIADAIKDQDFVLTHNHAGDYGHIHHVFVNRAVHKHHKNIIVFEGPDAGNEKCVVEQVDYAMDEFPSHASVVVKFHTDGHKNEYNVPDAMRSMIESN